MNRPFFSQRALGYRRNPFGALTDHEWAIIALLPAGIVDEATTQFSHLQFLGPMGSGKSTTLLKLAQILGDRGKKVAYEYLALGEREIKTDTAVLDVYFLDEMQRLSRQAANNLLSKLERSAGTGLRLIMSSHRDMGALFNRRQLPLKTFQLDISLTFQRFQAILDHRLATFAITDAKRTTLAPEAVEFLYATFYPNMRQAEYFLYDVWQKETAVRVITAVDLEQYYEAVTTKPTN